MRKALVIHPMLSFYAGAEYLCLMVCEALQEAGYRVSLASQPFSSSEIERLYGLRNVLQKCDYVSIPQFDPRFPHLTGLQRLATSPKTWSMFRNTDADIIFSTQSSPFIVEERIFHFVYDVNDLFGYPTYAAPLSHYRNGRGFRKPYSDTLRWANKLLWKKGSIFRDWFFAVGTPVLRDLKRMGYSNSSLAFPPCRVTFMPRLPKKRQVVQVARLIPEKRLELYLNIASKLPEYRFFLVGRRDSQSERIFPGYANSILSKLPKNLTYIDAAIREQPQVLEESQTFLYTGTGPGIMLTLVEAVAAGCIPFAPAGVGAADVVQATGVGAVYQSEDDAIAKVRASLEQDFGIEKAMVISQKAKRFGPETFKHWIKTIATQEKYSPISDFWPI